MTGGSGTSALVVSDSASVTPQGVPVECLDPREVAGWDSLLPGGPWQSFFHGSSWAEVLGETYRYQPRYFAKRQRQRVEALLPVMEVDSWLTGRRGVSLPFTDCCNPLVPDAATFQELFREALRLGRERGWKYLELRGGREHLFQARAACEFCVHELNLAGGERELFGRLDSAVRRAIRRAEKLGLEAEIRTDLEAVREFYGLQCQTRRKHGLPPQPLRFFYRIYDHVLSKGQGFVALVRSGGKPVAASVFFHAGTQAIFKYGASDVARAEMRGNNLAMWAGICHCASRGMASLHLGRSSVANEGLRQFKRGWGAVERRCEYLKYDFRKECFVAGRDGAFGWQNWVFRALPRGLSRCLGALLYRHVA